MTKKQWIIGASIVAILAAGSTGIVLNNQSHARAEKIQQQEKAAYTALMNKAKKSIETAEKFTDQKDVVAAHTAVKKLKSADQKSFNSRVKKVSRNWSTVKEASHKVSMAEKSNTKVLINGAQKVIDTLKDPMTKIKKANLQKRLDVVKKKLKAKEDKAAKVKAAEAKVDNNTAAFSSNNSTEEVVPATGDTVIPPAQGSEVPTYQGEDTGATDGAYYGGGTTGGETVTPSTPVPGGGGNSGNTAPPSTNDNPNYGHGPNGGASQEDLDNQAQDDEDWGDFFPGK